MDDDNKEEKMDCDVQDSNEEIINVNSKDSASITKGKENGLEKLHPPLNSKCIQSSKEENSLEKDESSVDSITNTQITKNNGTETKSGTPEKNTNEQPKDDILENTHSPSTKDMTAKKTEVSKDKAKDLTVGKADSLVDKSPLPNEINGTLESTEEKSDSPNCSESTNDKSSNKETENEDTEGTSDEMIVDVNESETDDKKFSSEEKSGAEDEKKLSSEEAESTKVDDKAEDSHNDDEKATDSKKDQLDDNSAANQNSTDDENSKNEPVKIKLRSFASLCDENDDSKEESKDDSSKSSEISGPMTNIFSSEISGVSVGDIVQHGNNVESDESGVMHLKISNVVGGEDCITGLIGDDDNLTPIQLTSLASLIEPLSPEDKNASKSTEVETVENKEAGKSASLTEDAKEACKTTLKILRSPLVVSMTCTSCKAKTVCKFRVISRMNDSSEISYVCSDKCKETTISSLPDNHVVEKPRLYFEKLCGMCGKEMSSIEKKQIFTWQTREFCNKLCLADHIGEVARSCFCCAQPVRVLFMGKYCVRFGSDVHQFCSNRCLEQYKTKISVCAYCQKNLLNIPKIQSPTNKEYCSNKCLKRAQRRDIGQQHYSEIRDCTVCNKNLVSKYEFINNNSTVWLCSEPCLNVYKYVNQVKSVNCCLCARLLNAEDSPSYFFNGHQLRVFCSDSCLSVFIISARKIVTCNYCKVKKYNFDMIGHFSADANKDVFYCSICCLNFVENKFNKENVKAIEDISSIDKNDKASSDSQIAIDDTQDKPPSPPNKTPPANVSPILKECNMCAKVEPAQFHMVMSDSTLRSFCSYICATRYKCTFGFQVSFGSQSQPSIQIDPNSNNSQISKEVPNKDLGKKDTAEQASGTDLANSSAKSDCQELLNILKQFEPSQVTNKSTMCRPIVYSKHIQTSPTGIDQESQTDSSRFPPLIPVPIPIYVPTPMMMYSAKVPMPLVIPLPVPVPIFIPTTEKTTKDIKQRVKEIQESMPAEPVESEMLLLAREAEAKANEEMPSQRYRSDSHENDIGSSFDQNELEILASLEDTLSKFHNQDKGASFSRGFKRKPSSDSYESESPAKKQKASGDTEEEDMPDHLNSYYGLLAWRDWAQKQGHVVGDPSLLKDPSEMTAEELCFNLILFITDLKRPDGQEYEIDTVFYILLGLQKHLYEKSSAHCIFLEDNFQEFTSIFNDIIKKKSQALLNIDRHILGETRITEEMMWEARQLGVHTPEVLINTLFYFNTKCFKLKTPEAHLNLSFSQIHKEWKRSTLRDDASYNRTWLLRYIPKNQKEVSYEMNENKEMPLRCPVKLYGFYITKCPESVRNRPFTYYVFPEQSCIADSPVWYSTVPLDACTLEKMLGRILLVKEIQEALAE